MDALVVLLEQKAAFLGIEPTEPLQAELVVGNVPAAAVAFGPEIGREFARFSRHHAVGREADGNDRFERRIELDEGAGHQSLQTIVAERRRFGQGRVRTAEACEREQMPEQSGTVTQHDL